MMIGLRRPAAAPSIAFAAETLSRERLPLPPPSAKGASLRHHKTCFSFDHSELPLLSSRILSSRASPDNPGDSQRPRETCVVRRRVVVARGRHDTQQHMRRIRGVLGLLLVVAMGSFASKTGAAAPDAAPPPGGVGVAFPPGVDKLGAGLLLVRADAASGEPSVLLLRRTSKHHGGAWGLPGGNVEPGDASLLATAAREAKEELGAGGAPPFLVRAQLSTRRGKRGQKAFAVFVAQVASRDALGYAPRLNEEHSAFRWWPAGEVERLAAAAAAAAGGASASAAASGEQAAAGSEEAELHPVVVLAIREVGGVAGLKRLLEPDEAM